MSRINVEKLRRRRGQTQTEFAKDLGVNQATVSRLESGEITPSGPLLTVLKQMAEQKYPTTTKESQNVKRASARP